MGKCRQTSRPLPERVAAAEGRTRILQAKNAAKAEAIKAKWLAHVEGKLPKMLAPKRGKASRTSSLYYDNASTSSRFRTTRNLAPRAPWAMLDKTTRDSLRRQVQQTERHNLLARGLINRYVDFIVGDGPVVNPATADEDWNREAKRLFIAWMEGTDPETVGRPNIRGMTRYVDDLREVVRAARLVDGDQLIVRTYDRNGLGTLQYIPAERLVNKGSAWADTETMCGGVEMNEVGQPIAYHVAGWERNGLTLTAGTYEVRAEHATLMVNPVGFKADQVRGEPQLQAALDLLDVLDGYIDNTALASEVATWIGAIFKTEKPEELRDILAGGVVDQPTRESENEPREVAFGPGFSHFCRPNEGVEQVKPEFPTTNFKDFVHSVVQIIGCDVGLPLVLMLYETAQMSWSNLRGTLAIAGRGFEYTQDWLRLQISADYRWKVRECIDRGLLAERNDWDKHAVRLPLPPSIDFEKEVGGYVKAIENNLMDEQTACDLLGMGTYEEIVARRGRNRELAAAANVLPPTMPGAGVQGGGNTGETAAENQTDGDGVLAKIGPEPLNGAQISGAIEILTKVREGGLSTEAGSELIEGLGFERERAVRIVSSLSSLTAGVGDVVFKREVLKALLAVPAARESIYNATDIEDLVEQTGLTPEAGYQAPWIPVVAQSGPLVTGETVKDGEGDVVGGAVEEAEDVTASEGGASKSEADGDAGRGRESSRPGKGPTGPAS